MKPKKSRAGCITCKRRRSKCDETKPGCLECEKRGLECEGYATAFKWKSFKGMPKDAAPNEKPHKADFVYHGRTPAAPPPSAAFTEASPLPPTPASAAATAATLTPPQTQFISVVPLDLTHRGSQPAQPAQPAKRAADTDESPVHKRRLVDYHVAVPQPQAGPSSSYITPPIDNFTEGATGTPAPPSGGHANGHVTAHLHGHTASPTVITSSTPAPSATYYNPPPATSSRPVTREPGYVTATSPPRPTVGGTVPYTHHPDGVTPAFAATQGTVVTSPTTQATLVVPLPMDDYYTRISRLFDHHTCGIVTIKDGPSDNPWRTSIWPLAQHHPVLYHAIAAMTLFHTARGNIGMRKEAFLHMRESIQSLASGIGNGTLEPHVALATTLSLAFAESWDQHITTGMMHLRGSKPLVKGLLAKYNNRLPSWLLFLYNSYIYLDVLARLTSTTLPDDDDDDSQAAPSGAGVDPLNLSEMVSADIRQFQQMLPFNSPYRDRHDSIDVSSLPLQQRQMRPHSNDMIPPGAADGIDPLLGCAQTLFPVIGKVGTLANGVARQPAGTVNSVATIARAASLMRLLESWRPANSVQYFVNDPDWDLHSCLYTAEAYRYAAMIHLVQAVPEVQQEPIVETARRVLTLLAKIPTSSRTCTTHIFPLLVSGCEALGEDRSFVKERWDSLAVRLWIGNVDRAMEVMEEVWRKRDRMHIGDGPVGVRSPAYWSQVMKEWKWEVLLG